MSIPNQMDDKKFDPSLRPRRPRRRASNRRVNVDGKSEGFTASKPFQFSGNQRQKLLPVNLKPKNRSKFIEQLSELAGDYLRSCDQPVPSKEVASYELKLIAHLCYQLVRQDRDSKKIESGLLRLLRDPNPLAQTLLWTELRRLQPSNKFSSFDYLMSNALDWDFIGKAAKNALNYDFKGDYHDANLALALQRLMDLYECVFGLTATWSSTRVGALGGGGGQQSEVSSPAGKLALTFFQIIDPKLQRSNVSNTLKAVLAARIALFS